MVHFIRPEGNGGHEPLPPPNVVVARSGTPMHELSPEAVKGILVNPIYTGVGPFPQLVEDAAWVRACAMLIEEEGADQFLVNLAVCPAGMLATGDGLTVDMFMILVECIRPKAISRHRPAEQQGDA